MRSFRSVKLLALGFALCLNPPSLSPAQEVLPSDRRIDWSQVGVEGGIPQRTTICASLNPPATAADINAAITACPPDGVVFLGAGSYEISAQIWLKKSRVTLRGAGPNSTVLLLADISRVLNIGQEWAEKPAIDIVSGYTKGSSQLVLSSAASLAAGAFVRVDELNDPSIPVTNVGYGTCTWCGRDNGSRVRGQIVKVTAISGNTVTISPPMYFTFHAANTPQVVPVGASTPSGMSVEFSGVEDLTIRNNWRPSKVRGTDNKEYSAMKDHTAAADGSNRPIAGSAWEYYWVNTASDGSLAPAWQAGVQYRGDYTSERIPLQVQLSANCWAKNIKIENCGARCVQLFYDNYRFELRDSHIARCINRYDSNNCYGTLIGMYNSGHLLENNIYESVADGPMLGWGASGNVMAYNYIYDARRTRNTRTWFTGIGASHHGAHTSFNLWEANVFESAYFDQYWGSHSHNVLYRNRIVGKYLVDGIAAEQGMQSIVAIGTEKNVRYQSYLGNVLGTDGYHNLYERNAEGCPNAYYDKLIYRTGYISSGSCDTAGDDPEVFNTMLRHLNFDYFSRSVKRCGETGEPSCQGFSPPAVIPASLYRGTKPSWFGGLAWPPIGADRSPMSCPLPAQLRFSPLTVLPPGCSADSVAPGAPTNLRMAP